MIELKSRHNNKNRFQTTMIGKSKIDYYLSKSLTKDLYFVFSFEDCDAIIKYEKDLFDKYNIEWKERNDRGKIEGGLYYMIDINDLTEF